jgi:aspartate 1-decarboxylase
MFRKVLRAKIHRLTLSEANVEYEGSITLPRELMCAAGIVRYEAVQVWDITNASRFETYVIEGSRAGHVCVNGAAARLVAPGDILIVAAFGYLEESALSEFHPTIIFVNDKNQITSLDG